MKIIDSKGRLFGLINIIDLFVIICIVAAVPFFIACHKVFSGIPKRPTPETMLMVIKQTEYNYLKNEVESLNRQVEELDEVLVEHPRMRKYFKD